VTLIDNEGAKTVKKYRWKLRDDLRLQLLDERIDSTDFGNDPRLKPWYKHAMKAPPLTNSWTSPYIFKTTHEPGISVSVWWHDLRNPEVRNIVTADILMLDIINYMNSLDISKNGHSILYTSGNKIICQSNHHRFSSIDSIKTYALSDYTKIGMPVFETMQQYIKEHPESVEEPFSFEFQGKRWWAEVVPYEKFGIPDLRIAVLVPEADFMAEMNRTRLIVILGFLLVFILTLFSIHAYRKQQQANVLLSLKNAEIEAQRDEINSQKQEIEHQHQLVVAQRDKIREIHEQMTKSITYAERIQSSALPSISILQNNVDDCFVLFKPRDIVSGDFYYFIKKENQLVVVVSDCTAHGVPRALMSMFGMSFIDNIVLENDNLDPGKILNMLRKHIIHALGQTQDGEGQRDGMDLSLCVLDLDTLKLKYAGANNPMIIVSEHHDDWADRKDVKCMRNDAGLNLFKVKADNMPISIYLKMDDFRTREFQLQKGDRVYLFSDGYIDQFGGKTESIRAAGGKKFKIKAFQKLLLEVAPLSAEEQSRILEKTLLEWRGELAQIDDVTVLGFRV
jgi:serine phosphatase RsbU (regulator of sigma subunit)